MNMPRIGDILEVLIDFIPFKIGDKVVVTNIFTGGQKFEVRSPSAVHLLNHFYVDEESKYWKYLKMSIPSQSPRLPAGANPVTTPTFCTPKAATEKNSEDTYKELKFCQHSWKTYNSGWTMFDYCEKCDIKREDADKQSTYVG